MTALIRLLTFLSVLLMPLDVGAAPAAPAEAHHATAAMQYDHCADERPEDGSGTVGHQCTMPCSVALPAADLATIELEAMARTPVEPSVNRTLAGVELEIATPPPKLS